ncbi:hypothetical protein [Mycobacterium sp.]|uniref:hypothetical protein n=1 Tax=Mycobacterium sp. TaxID=1785 RepID=UPI0025FBCC00|nr:hypothetical protein [Mycobacterium sp.]
MFVWHGTEANHRAWNYRTTWTLSKPPDSQTWDVSGEVNLRKLRQPSGSVFGTAPVNWTVDAAGGRSAGFDQHFDYPHVYGEMNGGLDVVLVDAHLTVHGERPRQGFMNFADANAHLDSWAALVGHGAPRSGPVLVDSGFIQVPHLEALSGISPIVSNHYPVDDIYEHKDPLFGATFNGASRLKWQDDEAEVTLFYQLSASMGGWYGFGLAFSPLVQVELSHPIPLSEFLTQWAWPLRGLMAASTGRREDISYMTCSPVIEGNARIAEMRQFQVFNASIAQEPYTSSNSLQGKEISAIRLNEGGLLLGLLRRWQRLKAAENPILNTYDITAVGPTQHPRARFLLLLQALEGLCGYEKRFEERQLRFTSARESAVNECQEKLDNRFFKFIKKNFPRRPPLGLDTVLREMLQGLPVDLEPELTESALVKSVRAEDVKITGTLDAVRVARNDLSHGNRAFGRRELAEAADILERLVRGPPPAPRSHQRRYYSRALAGVRIAQLHSADRDCWDAERPKRPSRSRRSYHVLTQKASSPIPKEASIRHRPRKRLRAGFRTAIEDGLT